LRPCPFLRRKEVIEPSFKIRYVVSCANVLGIERERLARFGESQLPIPLDGASVVELSGILGPLFETFLQSKVRGWLVRVSSEHEFGERINTVSRTASVIDFGDTPFRRGPSTQ
jgi:hypothetical protein